MVRECRHLGTRKLSFSPSRRWPGSGARPLATRRPDGAAKAAGPRAGPAQPAAIPSTIAPRPGRGATSHRPEAGGRAIQAKARLHPSHGPTAFPDRPDQSSPHGRQPTTEGRESSPPRSPIKGRSADERPAPLEPAGNQPPGSPRPQEGRHGRPAVGVGQGRGKVCLHRLSSASQQVAAIAVAAAARRDPSRSRPAPARPRRGSWDLRPQLSKSENDLWLRQRRFMTTLLFFYSPFPPLPRPSALKGPTPQLFCPPSVCA